MLSLSHSASHKIFCSDTVIVSDNVFLPFMVGVGQCLSISLRIGSYNGNNIQVFLYRVAYDDGTVGVFNDLRLNMLTFLTDIV